MDETHDKKKVTGAYVRLPTDLHQEAKRIAKQRGMSLNQLFTSILDDYLRRTPVPLSAVERDGEVIYEIDIPPGYFVEGGDDKL